MDLERGNMASSVMMGYQVFNTGLGSCTQVTGFYFHHVRSDAIYLGSPSRYVMIDSNVVVDSRNDFILNFG